MLMRVYDPQTIQEPRFFQPEVSRATGVPNKTINNLIDRGVFNPKIFDPGRGNRRQFSAFDAARLLVIHSLAPLIGGYEEADKAAVYLWHRLNGTEPALLGDLLIIRPKGFFAAPPFPSQHESEKWDMCVLNGPSTAEIAQEKTTILFPFGLLVLSMWERLWSPYDLKKIERPEDWDKAHFADPNEGTA